jgi:hypothetical protein
VSERDLNPYACELRRGNAFISADGMLCLGDRRTHDPPCCLVSGYGTAALPDLAITFGDWVSLWPARR